MRMTEALARTTRTCILAKATIKKRKLPDVPKITTKTVRDNHFDRNLNETSGKVMPLVNRGEHRRRSAEMKLKSDSEKEIIYEMYRRGVPRKEIAKKIGVDKSVIVGIIARGFLDGNLTEYVVSEDEQEILDLYNQGLSYREICKRLGITQGAVSGTLTRLRREGKCGKRS